MLNAIELGQVAEAADGYRRARLLPEGLTWITGPYADSLVKVEGYLLSDLWTIFEDEMSERFAEQKADWQRKRMEMLENQLFEQRARRFDPPNIEE